MTLKLDTDISAERKRLIDNVRYLLGCGSSVLRPENRVAMHTNFFSVNGPRGYHRHRDILHTGLARNQCSRPNLYAVRNCECRNERGDADDYARRGEQRPQRIGTQCVRTSPGGLEQRCAI